MNVQCGIYSSSSSFCSLRVVTTTTTDLDKPLSPLAAALRRRGPSSLAASRPASPLPSLAGLLLVLARSSSRLAAGAVAFFGFSLSAFEAALQSSFSGGHIALFLRPRKTLRHPLLARALPELCLDSRAIGRNGEEVGARDSLPSLTHVEIAARLMKIERKNANRLLNKALGND